MLATGKTIGGYRIEGVLGTGAMGAVYEATQLALDRTVALKVIAPHLGVDPAFRERFRREAMLQAALEHPHVVTVYEAGESEAGLYLAMRLVRGSSLKEPLAPDGLDGGRAPPPPRARRRACPSAAPGPRTSSTRSPPAASESGPPIAIGLPLSWSRTPG